MKKAVATAPGLKFVRALLIIGALVSLCASDGVGPRLLPLPAAQVTAGGQTLAVIDDAASPAPVPGRGPGARVEMAATAQYRAGSRHNQEQPATNAAPASPVPPVNLVSGARVTYHPLPLLSPPASEHAGRAPPRLA